MKTTEGGFGVRKYRSIAVKKKNKTKFDFPRDARMQVNVAIEDAVRGRGNVPAIRFPDPARKKLRYSGFFRQWHGFWGVSTGGPGNR